MWPPNSSTAWMHPAYVKIRRRENPIYLHVPRICSRTLMVRQPAALCSLRLLTYALPMTSSHSKVHVLRDDHGQLHTLGRQGENAHRPPEYAQREGAKGGGRSILPVLLRALETGSTLASCILDADPCSLLMTSSLPGDDPTAWSLPYFPKTDSIYGNKSDCVQVRDLIGALYKQTNKQLLIVTGVKFHALSKRLSCDSAVYAELK